MAPLWQLVQGEGRQVRAQHLAAQERDADRTPSQAVLVVVSAGWRRDQRTRHAESRQLVCPIQPLSRASGPIERRQGEGSPGEPAADGRIRKLPSIPDVPPCTKGHVEERMTDQPVTQKPERNVPRAAVTPAGVAAL